MTDGCSTASSGFYDQVTFLAMTKLACIRLTLRHNESTAYLTSTLAAIVNGHRQSRNDELLPWHSKGPSSQPLDGFISTGILVVVIQELDLRNDRRRRTQSGDFWQK